MVKKSPSGLSWKAGSLTGLSDASQHQRQGQIQDQSERQKPKERENEIYPPILSPDDLLEDDTLIGEYFRFAATTEAQFREKESSFGLEADEHQQNTDQKPSRLPKRGRSGMGLSESTLPNDDKEGGVKHRDRERSVGEGDASSSKGRSRRAAWGLPDPHRPMSRPRDERSSSEQKGNCKNGGEFGGRSQNNDELKHLLHEFKDAEEIDEDTDLCKYVESRLYQNLRRYPSDFDLPGGGSYEPIEGDDDGGLHEHRDDDEDDDDDDDDTGNKLFDLPALEMEMDDEFETPRSEKTFEDYSRNQAKESLSCRGEEMGKDVEQLAKVANVNANQTAALAWRLTDKMSNDNGTRLGRIPNEEGSVIPTKTDSCGSNGRTTRTAAVVAPSELTVTSSKVEILTNEVGAPRTEQIRTTAVKKRADKKTSDEKTKTHVSASYPLKMEKTMKLPVETTLTSTMETRSRGDAREGVKEALRMERVFERTDKANEISAEAVEEADIARDAENEDAATNTRAKKHSVPLNLDREREVISDAIMRLRRVENRLMRRESDFASSSTASATVTRQRSESTSSDGCTLAEADEIVDRIHEMCSQLRTLMHGKIASKGGKKVMSDQSAESVDGMNTNNNKTTFATEKKNREQQEDSRNQIEIRRMRKGEENEITQVAVEEEGPLKVGKGYMDESTRLEASNRCGTVESDIVILDEENMMDEEEERKEETAGTGPDGEEPTVESQSREMDARHASFDEPLRTAKSTTDSVVEAWTRDCEAEGLFDCRRYSNLVVRENGKLKMVEELEDQSHRRAPPENLLANKPTPKEASKRLPRVSVSDLVVRNASLKSRDVGGEGSELSTLPYGALNKAALSTAEIEEDNEKLSIDWGGSCGPVIVEGTSTDAAVDASVAVDIGAMRKSAKVVKSVRQKNPSTREVKNNDAALSSSKCGAIKSQFLRDIDKDFTEGDIKVSNGSRETSGATVTENVTNAEEIDVDIAIDEGARKKSRATKADRPKTRWTALRQETAVRIFEQKDATRAAVRGWEGEKKNKEEEEEVEKVREVRVNDAEGEGYDYFIDFEEEVVGKGGKGRGDKWMTEESRSTNRCAEWVVKNTKYARNLALRGEYDDRHEVEEEEEEEEEGDMDQQDGQRISPREAQAELRRQALRKQKKRAKDFTFKSLKNFWDKVDRENA